MGRGESHEPSRPGFSRHETRILKQLTMLGKLALETSHANPLSTQLEGVGTMNIHGCRLSCVTAIIAAAFHARADEQGISPATAELAPLAVLAGQWEGEFEIGVNSGNKMKAEQKSEWILDGHHLATHATARNEKGDSFKVLIVTGYDQGKKEFTRTLFFSGGGVFRERGDYDPVAKTFTFQETDPNSGASKTSTATVESDDVIRWKMLIPRNNESPLEVVGVNRRKK
jgi:hypothetical protein